MPAARRDQPADQHLVGAGGAEPARPPCRPDPRRPRPAARSRSRRRVRSEAVCAATSTTTAWPRKASSSTPAHPSRTAPATMTGCISRATTPSTTAKPMGPQGSVRLEAGHDEVAQDHADGRHDEAGKQREGLHVQGRAPSRCVPARTRPASVAACASWRSRTPLRCIATFSLGARQPPRRTLPRGEDGSGAAGAPHPARVSRPGSAFALGTTVQGHGQSREDHHGQHPRPDQRRSVLGEHLAGAEPDLRPVPRGAARPSR